MHEDFFANTLCNYFKKNNIHTRLNIARKPVYFNGVIGNLNLLLFGFRNSNANINIVVSRVALSSIFRNLFNNNKTIIVMHYFDKDDGKGWFLKLYYQLLFFVLKFCRFNKVMVMAVSPFWQHYFEEKCIKNCFIFPNLFDNAYYQKFNLAKKSKSIHLGQLSWKNDPKIYMLAEMLSTKGYRCYFTTNNKYHVEKTKHYEVIFDSFENYLTLMSKCKYTLALTKINEGWNRVAHESLLVGTQVIGYNRGGLGDLLMGSNSIVANDIDEVYEAIVTNKKQLINDHFLNKYDIANLDQFLIPIVNWLK